MKLNMNKTMTKKFRRKEDGVIAGICSGLGQYFSIDPVIWRIVFILGSLCTVWPFVLFYLACWIFVPEEEF